jgi:hypothetical protein
VSRGRCLRQRPRESPVTRSASPHPVPPQAARAPTEPAERSW